MKKILPLSFIFFFGLLLIKCKKTNDIKSASKLKNSEAVLYAKGFTINEYNGFTILKVLSPWPKSNQTYTYILRKKNTKIPDSLAQNIIVNIPIKTIVVTSTTHIPSLEMLGVSNSLVGFPNLNYISSDKIRALIDAGKVAELGNNQSLNIEKTIELAPSVIVGYGIDDNNPTLDNLKKSGQKILLNGDWNEQTPLGKAEWIKFFGALYGLDAEAKLIFDKIAFDYDNIKNIAKTAKKVPTVIAGEMFEDIWYMPKGDSWGSLLLADANANYLWSKTKGTGSLSLSFETVFDRGKNADCWIQGQFSTYAELQKNSVHYDQFDAFKAKNIFSFSSKKGKTGGVLYYELAPNRPDLVLKDLVKALHPELLAGYEPYFITKLK